ncbi:MAG: glycosyltransferase N-terminal domain-containing protein, partial [Pseudomonadota bacterium]
MRKIYSLITTLLQIPLAGYWFFRGVVNQRYRRGFRQRFGFGYPKLDGCIWVHAVSVGEVQAAAPLIRSLKERFPDFPILVSTVTPTGAARVRSLFGDSVTHCYIPFEAPYAVNRFFAAVNPALAL